MRYCPRSLPITLGIVLVTLFHVIGAARAAEESDLCANIASDENLATLRDSITRSGNVTRAREAAIIKTERQLRECARQLLARQPSAATGLKGEQHGQLQVMRERIHAVLEQFAPPQTLSPVSASRSASKNPSTPPAVENRIPISPPAPTATMAPASTATPASPAPLLSIRPLTGPVAQIIATLQPGWTKLLDKFGRVMVPRNAPVSGTSGAFAVLSAWNNVPFDGVRYLYAHGGGHADYGGNEVYRFDLSAMRWERLNEPSLYPERVGDKTAPVEQRCPYPISGPPSTHTYDAKEWSSALNRFLLFSTNIAFCPSGMGERWGDGNIWSLNTANTWELLGKAPFGVFGVVDLPNGNLALIGNSTTAIFDPRTQQEVGARTSLGGTAGDSTSIYDPKRNALWVFTRAHIMRMDLTPDYKFAGGWQLVVTKNRGEEPHPGSTAFNGSVMLDPVTGRLLRWSGGKNIVAFDPETKVSTIYSFAAGPDGYPPLYRHSFPVPGYPGVFVAVSNKPEEGVWLLKMPDGPGDALPVKTLQRQIDEGAKTFLAGRYSAGAVITKGGDYDFAGVIPGLAQGKAAVVVNTTEPVTIRNLTASGFTCASCGGLRGEGDYTITLINAHIFDSDTCILTGNAGGTLTIQGGIFENCGGQGGQSHIVYMGQGKKLTILNSTLRNPRGLGHILKSRANETIVEGSILAMLGGSGSRVIDIPAGGRNRFTGNVIEQGPHADNQELAGHAMEQASMQWSEQVTIYENNLIISDFSKKKPYLSFCKNRHQINLRGNRIIWNRESPPNGALTDAGCALVDESNRIFSDRASAGLQPFPDIPKIKH